MIIVNDMPSQIDESLVQLLAKVETATVGHFLTDVFMSPDIRPVIMKKPPLGPLSRFHCLVWIQLFCIMPWDCPAW